MQPSVVVFGMIIVFAAMMFIVLVSGPIGMFLKFAVRSVIGAGLIYICNMFLGHLGIYIGINIFTAAIVGFLGLPGLGTLILIMYIIS